MRALDLLESEMRVLQPEPGSCAEVANAELSFQLECYVSTEVKLGLGAWELRTQDAGMQQLTRLF